MQSAANHITVEIEIRHIGDRYLSSCPALDVFSQGDTEEEAANHLLDALSGFIETCHEMGTLDSVLAEAGLVTEDASHPVKRLRQSINIPSHVSLGRQHEARPQQV